MSERSSGDNEFQIAGEIADAMSRERLGEVLCGDGWRVDVGPYVVRLMDDRLTFVFAQADSCFLLEDAFGGDDLAGETRRVSDHLAARGLRHRFEIFDGSGALTTYLHHEWPQS